MYLRIIKPALDWLVALLILLVSLPVLIPVMILLAVSNRGKVWFIQARPGKNQIVFNIVKFKTMNDKVDPSGHLLPDEQRLTPIGNFVRKTSLDELPQLFNVLKGEMSIVGPRPLLVEYLPLYNPHQQRRHEVRPGITGWAQVNGRNTITWQAKFDFDVWYVDHASFWLDIKILFKTLIRVLKSEGISSGTSSTMERFRGN